MHGVFESFEHALMITSFVFAMMVLVDFLNVLTRGRIGGLIRGGGFRQYVVTSFLGVTPGCLGAFMNVSFYIRGIISFGAIAGGMIATSGDEAFIMLAMFPKKALILFGLLFLIGIIASWIIDKLLGKLKIETRQCCELQAIHEADLLSRFRPREVVENLKNLTMIRFLLLALLTTFLYLFVSGTIGPELWDWKRISFIFVIGITLAVVLVVPDHYLEVHIWDHITKRHLWKIMAWSFGAILIVHFALETWDLEAFVKSHMVWVLFIALLFGLIPESGPHLIFVVMFAKGLIPFSVLLASSIVQDGHGMLPLLSYSVKDSVFIKLFNLAIGFIVGITLYYIGY